MAKPSTTTQVLQEDDISAVVLFNIASGGDTEFSNDSLLDISADLNSASEVVVNNIVWSLVGFNLEILWDADANVKFLTLPSGVGSLDAEPTGGLINNAGAGKTGDILLTSSGIALTGNDHGTILLELEKIA